MKILHIVPGMGDVANGMVVVAKLLAKEQGDAEVVDLNDVDRGKVAAADEVWVHGMWRPKEWLACWHTLKAGKKLVRMTHGSLSPIYLTRQSPWKKRLVSPIERYFLRNADKVVATCNAEVEWIRSYEPRVRSIEIVDLKRFFNLNPVNPVNPVKKDLHLLDLGRRHPLKGLSYLETALATYYNKWSSAPSSLAPTTACADNPSSNPSRKAATYYNKCPIEFRVVSAAFGDELERVWDWCDVLVLPTLSENFGLVIAEALERGKSVITTDGAPAWGENLSRVERVDGGMWSGYGGRLIYLKGYRYGTPEDRVRLLKSAIENLLSRASLTPPAAK